MNNHHPCVPETEGFPGMPGNMHVCMYVCTCICWMLSYRSSYQSLCLGVVGQKLQLPGFLHSPICRHCSWGWVFLVGARAIIMNRTWAFLVKYHQNLTSISDKTPIMTLINFQVNIVDFLFNLKMFLAVSALCPHGSWVCIAVSIFLTGHLGFEGRVGRRHQQGAFSICYTDLFTSRAN